MPVAPLTPLELCVVVLSLSTSLNRLALKYAAFFVRTLKMRKRKDGVLVGLMLSLFCHWILLQICGDIETYPGVLFRVTKFKLRIG